MSDTVMKLNIYCSEDEPQEINIDVEITASTEDATGNGTVVTIFFVFTHNHQFWLLIF